VTPQVCFPFSSLFSFSRMRDTSSVFFVFSFSSSRKLCTPQIGPKTRPCILGRSVNRACIGGPIGPRYRPSALGIGPRPSVSALSALGVRYRYLNEPGRSRGRDPRTKKSIKPLICAYMCYILYLLQI